MNEREQKSFAKKIAREINADKYYSEWEWDEIREKIRKEKEAEIIAEERRKKRRDGKKWYEFWK